MNSTAPIHLPWEEPEVPTQCGRISLPCGVPSLLPCPPARMWFYSSPYSLAQSNPSRASTNATSAQSWPVPGQSLASPYPAQHQHDFSSIIPPARDILLFVPGFITTQPWLSASANTDSSVRLSLDTTSKGAPPVIAPSSHLLSLQDPTTHCAQLPPVITPVPPSHCSKIPLLTA